MVKEKDPIQWMAEELLYQMKVGGPIAQAVKQIKNTSLDDLSKALDTDEKRKAFWINIYNGSFLVLQNKNKLKAPKIFTDRRIRFGNFTLSLDDIEHGILRKRKWKYGLGYITNPLYSRIIKHLEVAQLDYRIHFALNCGAKSCPIIRSYDPLHIDTQLNIAQKAFLKEDAEVKGGKLWISMIYLWFFNDFGGKRGIEQIHIEKLKLKGRSYQLRYRRYDWTPQSRFE